MQSLKETPIEVNTKLFPNEIFLRALIPLKASFPIEESEVGKIIDSIEVSLKAKSPIDGSLLHGNFLLPWEKVTLTYGFGRKETSVSFSILSFLLLCLKNNYVLCIYNQCIYMAI